MADDPRANVDPAEEAGRRVREGRAMREAARAEAARRAAVVEEGMEGNRRYARNQDAARKIQNAVTTSEPAANASREAATRNMMQAGRAAAAAEGAAAEGTIAAAARRLAANALRVVRPAVTAGAAKLAGAASLLIPNNSQQSTELPGGHAGIAAEVADRDTSDYGLGRGAPGESPTRRPKKDDEARLPSRVARSAAPESEDYASTSDIVPAPQRRAETVRRPAPRRVPAPQRMSDSDRLNAMEMDRIMHENYSRPEPSSSEPMKKGGKAQAYKKGGSIVKMAGGGAVRGCGIASRGKTRGRMV